MPAIQSSAMMPQPRGSASSRRIGYGFQMSNNRNSTNPSSRYFQLSRLKAEYSPNTEASSPAAKCAGSQNGIIPNTNVRCMPDTSSTTTYCGSSLPE